MNPFEFVKSINFKTGNIIDRDYNTERYYVPFQTNKVFSMFPDTVLCANAMNGLYDLPKKMQYDYFYSCVKKKNRFSKWLKPEQDEFLEKVMSYYNVNRTRAKEYVSFMVEEDIEIFNKMTHIGGVKK